MSKGGLREKFLRRFNAGDRAPLGMVHPSIKGDDFIPTLLNFVAAYPSFSRKLFDVHGDVTGIGKRLGKGEVLLYFLFDDVELGGHTSSIDVLIDGEPYLEVKCSTKECDRYTSFVLGIDEVPASLKHFYRILKLFEESDMAGKLKLPQNFANISKSKLEELKRVNSGKYRRSEDRYFRELLSGPVGKKTYLFFDTDTALPVFFGPFKRENLKIDRISGGLTRLSLKP